MAKKRTEAAAKGTGALRKKSGNRGPARSAGGAMSEIGDDAIRRATGRGWEEWFTLLDRDGAREMAHRDIAAMLGAKHGVGPWWRQMVTVGYERARGKRERHQTARGYSISASRTMVASSAAVFGAWTEARRRARWLSEVLTIRKATPGKSVRITWGDGTNVEVNVYEKGAARCQVAVQHDKLKSAAAAQKLKKYWRGKLDDLEAFLAPSE